MSRKQRERAGASSHPTSAPMLHDEASLGGHRHARLQQIIREELDALFRTEISDPVLGDLRVVSAELSVDYRSVRVRYIVPDEALAEKAERALVHATNYIRRRLIEALDLKRSPNLHFIYDRQAAASARAAALLDEERRERDAAQPPPPTGVEEDEDELEEGEEIDDEE